MNDQKEYRVLEGEFRQNLLRGYCRLRQALAQGRKLREAERVIELLGEPHLLTMQHPRQKWKLQIPLVFVSSWELGQNQRVKQVSLNQLQPDTLTLYKRRHRVSEPDHRIIHDKLVKALRAYIVECESKGGLLLDGLWAPRPHEADYDEITSENWFGLHDLGEGQHWLFAGIKNEELPNQVWKTNALMRLTFPLHPALRNYPYKMITLIFGLAIIPQQPREGGKWGDEERRRMVRWVRRLASIARNDILHLYDVVEKRKAGERIHLVPPDWLKNNERDALHLAVDDLHRKIIEFARRVEAEGWSEPQNGLNFLIAFKELDDNYRACLRYRLSLPNLHALGAGARDVDGWREEFRGKLREMEEDLRHLFRRAYENEVVAERRFGDYMDRCREAINQLFKGAESLDDVKRRAVDMIEATPYRMRLTPGYYVMDSSHPEIIKAWLRDPRAKRFDEYPPELLAWEATALPPQIYYSQIADGALSIGICGVNAEILEKCPAYYELQEIIDESGPRFRYIICEEEFQQLEEELKEDLKMLKGRPRLWVSALKRFRRLAYYHFQDTEDFLTKLVYDRDIRHFDGRPWIEHRGENWQELCGLTAGDAPVLAGGSEHIPVAEKWRAEPQEARGPAARGFYEMDFLKNYLERQGRESDGEPNLEGARLHRIKMKEARDPDKGETSLLVLIPDQQNNEFAKELINRFVNQCELAFEDYERAIEWSETYRQSPPDGSSAKKSAEEYDVFLCYNREDRDAVLVIAEKLKGMGIKPWLDEWELRPGSNWLDALENQIKEIRSAAVFFGKSGLGPWQKNELNAILATFNSRNRPIIPVILLNGRPPEELPLFLKQRNWVNFNTDSEPIERLRWGITGERP